MIPELLAAVGGLSAASVPTLVMMRRMRRMRSQLGLARDAYELAHFEATHDDLTGLANRRAFYEAASVRVATACPERPMALALVDVDAFKAINDTYGHLTGDFVLRSVGRALARRFNDGLVARLGGDEYAVLVELREGEPPEDVGTAAADASDGVEVDKPNLAVTFSVGVAEVRGPTDLTEVLSCADAALYRSKQTGGAEVFAPVRDDDRMPESRPLIRTRDLDVTPVPVSSGMDGGR